MISPGRRKGGNPRGGGHGTAQEAVKRPENKTLKIENTASVAFQFSLLELKKKMTSQRVRTIFPALSSRVYPPPQPPRGVKPTALTAPGTPAEPRGQRFRQRVTGDAEVQDLLWGGAGEGPLGAPPSQFKKRPMASRASRPCISQ